MYSTLIGTNPTGHTVCKEVKSAKINHWGRKEGREKRKNLPNERYRGRISAGSRSTSVPPYFASACSSVPLHGQQAPGHTRSGDEAVACPSLKTRLSELVHLTCCRICVRALSGTIRYHNKQYRPQKGGICIANHTSPIDVLILTTDGCYAMVGQVHGGLMGIIQRAMVKACPHVWFERSEMKDRHLVTKRLKEHYRG
nr:glycerol-3-phosphate acyltransferase 3-like [Microcebus murinus]